jgi:uncharacterized Ntn-hydrolase superfamily protein
MLAAESQRHVGDKSVTFSIIAHDDKTGQVGIAVASKAFATGARVPFVRTGVGAIASQAKGNQLYGPRGLALLAVGASAADTVRLLIAADEDQDIRQVHVMDRQGRFAAHTGAECLEWCGHLVLPGFSLAGNILAGANVLEAMAAAYEAGAELVFAQRLIAALKAAEQAGGDKRGRQSAALLIHGDKDWALIDIRVDDHADPLAELERLEQVARDE